MVDINRDKALQHASELMSGFAKRTGLTSDEQNGAANRRYLWTDAFALLNFMALKQTTDDKTCDAWTLRLIKEVHCHLGKFSSENSRSGWLSGYEGEKARNHPTVAGLRIGKEIPERGANEVYDAQREWNRDGQYYHYHTRWIVALLTAAFHFDEPKFADWALDLSLAGQNFIEDRPSGLRMYWKMSVDLSRPLVPMMGAHDPLDGFLCALQAGQTAGSQPSPEFKRYIKQLEQLCARSSWTTEDELGLGSLALNVIRAAQLQLQVELPEAVQPKTLLKDWEKGIARLVHTFQPYEAADYRLAFRECGLSLGLRCLQANLELLRQHDLEPTINTDVWRLADEIEAFWLRDSNQQAETFQQHLDINEVSLASSLLAQIQPQVFSEGSSG